MSKQMMTLSRFEELADLFGGSIADWPASEQSAATALAAQSDAAQRVLQEALALDGMLSDEAAFIAAVPAMALPPALAEAMARDAAAAIAPREPVSDAAQSGWFERIALWAERFELRSGLAAFGLSAAAAAGLMLGVMTSSAATASDADAFADLLASDPLIGAFEMSLEDEDWRQ